MGLGVELSESLTGTFHRFDDPMKDRPLRLALRLVVDGGRRFARERRIRVSGTIVAEGLAHDGGQGRPVRGTVAWKLFTENRVPYALSFEGDDGETYHLRGQRDFSVHDVVGSLTTLALSLYDARDEEIGRAALTLEPRANLRERLRALRPRLRLSRRGAREGEEGS